jgi:N-acyl homoserine lactone hydrolase
VGIQGVNVIKLQILFEGFPGSSSRGFLGWSLVALLETGHQTVLFDTGGYNERQTLLKKMTELNVHPDQVDMLILSHLHFDHIVNFGLFKNAQLFIHEEEINHVRQNKDDVAVPYEVLPHLFTRNITILQGKSTSFDCFTLVHTPGHSPGHVSLFLKQDGQTVALAADAVKNIMELKTGNVMMTQNMQDTLDSIRYIKENADIIYPGHDSAIRMSKGKASRLKDPVISIIPPDGLCLYKEGNTLSVREINDLDRVNQGE